MGPGAEVASGHDGNGSFDDISASDEGRQNPKALQDHLGHASPLMTLRYLSTLQEEDSLRIQQDVVF